MSDSTYLGRKIGGFSSAPQFDGYSKVVIIVSDDTEYSAGTDAGRTLTLNNPWGTQAMADNILASIRGFQYQPYTAKDALLNPAAELGDGIGVNNVYGGIYAMDITFGGHCRATVSAPSEEEIDHEYPYVPKQERKITRRLHNLTSELKVQAGQISAEVAERKNDVSVLDGKLTMQAGLISSEVSERKSEISSLQSSLKQESDRITAEIKARTDGISSLQSTLDIQADQISAKVSKSGGKASSFGWALTDSSWELFSGGGAVLKATSSGLEVRGKITALSGAIGGFDIQSNYLSYNGQTWGGTNNTGIYIGQSGIQLGTNFKVDAAGHLTAASGTFTGSVYAGNIQYGGGYGTLSGLALSGSSIAADRLIAGSITTNYTSSGINASLGYADYASGVFGGWNTATHMYAGTVRAENSLYANGTFYIKRNGVTHSVQIRNLTIDGIIYGVLTI